MASDREFLRHTLATLAYRGAKATRNAPPEFATFRASPTTRTPARTSPSARGAPMARSRCSSGG